MRSQLRHMMELQDVQALLARLCVGTDCRLMLGYQQSLRLLLRQNWCLELSVLSWILFPVGLALRCWLRCWMDLDDETYFENPLSFYFRT